jgi:phosphate-selective porin OprO/OprP
LTALANPTELTAPGAVSSTRGPREGSESLAEPKEDERKPTLTAGWLDGLHFRSRDDVFRIHVGGNVQIDSTWLIGPNSAFFTPSGSTSGIGGASATFIRRARIRLDGDIFDQFDYMIEYDLANASNDTGNGQPPSFGSITGSPAPTNIWMQVRDVPFFGNVRFGNQVKPIGFSNQVYQGWLPFIERADNWDAFQGADDNGFSIGLTARNHTDNERITWQYGVYRPLVNVFGVALNKMQWGGRVTALPVFEEDGRVLIHIGMGTLNGELPQDQLRVRARPLLRNGPGFAVPVLVNTGDVPGSRQYTLAPEFAAVYGSWTFQAEWTGQFLTQAGAPNGQNQGTVLFHGGYAEVLYFLTGEYQEYDKKEGAFGRVVPKENLRIKRGFGIEGCGAWQVGVRFSYLDLNDKGIQGGTLYDWTAGINWFLNPNMKIQVNAILERRNQPGVEQAWISGVGLRGAYDF